MGSGSPSLNDIQFLAFQGGGGKGAAYLGALEYLEHNNGPLPIYGADSRPTVQGAKLLGVSGASAGAITALMVALGFGAEGLKQRYKAPQLLNELLDPPQIGTVRWVAKNGLEENTSQLEGTVITAAQQVMGMLGLTEVLTALGLFLHAVLDLANESLLAQLLGNYQYMLCLLLDGGMLSGTKLRTWLGKMVSESPLITAHNAASAPNSPQKTWTDGTKITFAQLYQAGCEQGNLLELAVTGTNATTERPVVFTRTSTPDFPVVEAVAISATLPLLFKPVWLSASMPFLRALPQTAYAGWYLDGGLTNNLPIHLFDTYSAGGGFAIPFDPLAPTAARPGAPPPLNKNMLGLLLMEGNKPPTKAAAPPPDPSGTESVLRTLGMLWGGLTFGATQGQLRSSAEVDQTVTIYSNGAGLLDLAAPGTVVDSAAQSGYDSLAAHYPDVTPAGP